MTEQEAIKAAWAFVNGASLKVVALDSIQRILGESLPAGSQERRDTWVVRFRRPSPIDAVESPGLLLIDVDDSSGHASLFESL